MQEVMCCASCKHSTDYGCDVTERDEYGMYFAVQPYQFCHKHEWKDVCCSRCKEWKPMFTFAIITDPDTDLKYICMDCYEEMDIII